MKLVLTRDVLEPDFTLGKLSVDDNFFCFTVEDSVRDKKIFGKTAIPFGTYDIVLTFSNRFQKVLPLLVNVPNFDGVRIHSGNTAEDTEGCLIVGLERTDKGVAKSRAAMEELMPKIKAAKENGNHVWIEIV